ncbi:endoribonuclease Dicer-like 1 [Homarus americanus]|uniref:Endoribonuclease Dicer-like 1 n=1 Tax=Homarus americanus TaxID=6706 RepID=A0A8J5MQT3_HOMAM|nr:endoribonuclease Dicer-like 1 [Homarus americanus]
MEETYCEDPEGSDASGATENQECDVNFTARPYQVELFEHAKKQNSILVLGTGSGKTFISILLIKELSDQIREPFSKGGKRTVFIVNTVPLVHQQALAIETHTALKVGKYEGSMGVDFWTAEMWKEELEKNEVLVFVAQIFLDLVLHASLPLSAVNLLIMDECHHTVGNHPMREIMRQYEGLKIQSPEKCPRIMGLTACVIHRKCRKSEVMDTMKKLEAAMDSALVTTTYQKEVVKCSTAPKEKVICYGTDEISEYQECIIAQLTGISEEVKERDDIQIKYKKLVRKKIINIINIMTTLGDWCVARAIKYEMDHFEDIKKIEDVPVVRELMTLLQNRLQEIYYICVVEETKMENPIDYVTKKVKRLFEIFRACNREVYGIIFVERRNTAKILYDLLLNVADTNEDLSFVKPLYVVGSNAYTGTDIRLAELELRKQRETLDKFCNGECNFIVSTSVLEEGVDIRKCNIVIRFDEPANYRAFVQSKGRARALPSRYLLMVNETKLQELKDSIDLYKEIEKALTLLCHDRQLPTLEEIRKHYVEDEYIEPYLPYGPDGAKVTLNSAISLINVYCGKLPQDKFTELTAEVVYTKYEEGVKAQIKLPMNAPLKVPVIGDCMVNKELAKKSAAIYLCKKLHHMGELDNRLRPAEVLDDSILEGLVEVPPEEALKDDAPDPGTKSRRQVYTKEVCSAFTHNYEGNYQLYSIVIHPKSNPPKNLIINSDKMDSTIGFICKGNLIHCPFPLYFSKWGEVEVRVEHIKELTNLGLELFYKIEHFHKLTVEMLLHINTSLFEFSSRDAGVFIVPVKEKNINLDILNRIMPLASLRSPVVNTTDSQSFYFERSNFEDAIIYPLYGPQPDQLFYVTQIMDDTNPHSEFPDSKKQYSSYAEYFLLKYELKITNIQQPLIAAKHLPKELKYLEIPAVPLKNNTGKVGRDPPRFLPEFCGVLPLKASLWWQIMCVPSIFYRLNSLNLAHQVNTLMNIAKYQIKAAEHTTVNFGWPEESVNRLLGPFGNNLAACLLRKKSNFIHPFMLVHALTLRGAHDGFDMERLEVLGDSFLKYITAEYLFLKDNKDHEGRLSLRRCKLVCNRTLYSLAKQRKLPEKIQAINLSPQTNGFLPGFSVKPMMDRKLRSWNIPHNKWSQLPLLDHPEDILEKESLLKLKQYLHL